MRSLFAEFAGVALIAAGTYVLAGLGAALIVVGILVVVGAQFYGVDDDDVPAGGGLTVTVTGDEENSGWPG